MDDGERVESAGLEDLRQGLGVVEVGLVFGADLRADVHAPGALERHFRARVDFAAGPGPVTNPTNPQAAPGLAESALGRVVELVGLLERADMPSPEPLDGSPDGVMVRHGQLDLDLVRILGVVVVHGG